MLPPPDDGHEACNSRPGHQESRAGEGWLAGFLPSVAGGRAPGHGQQEHEVKKSGNSDSFPKHVKIILKKVA